MNSMIDSFKTTQGILFVDKPSGPTSYDVIRWIKTKMPGLKVGHTGTLDPLSSGLLILLFGPCTKKQSEFMKMDKTYTCRMRFGCKTNSGDVTGEISEEKPVPHLSESVWETIRSSFKGDLKQVPPMFSALKHKGQPLYKLARQGKVVPREERSIHIYDLQIHPISDSNEADLTVRCSSGTYIRSLVEEIGEKCGSVATVVSMTRQSIGPFNLDRALSGNKIRMMEGAQIKNYLHPAPVLLAEAVTS